MCGRYTLRRRDLEAVKRELGAETGGGSYLWQPRYNLAPTDQLPILVPPGERFTQPAADGLGHPART